MADIFYDIDRYEGPAANDLRLVVAQYAQSVLAEDWPALRKTARLSEIGYAHWEAIYQHILDLGPENPRQHALRDHMLEAVHTIAELRQARINAATNPISALFWMSAIGGVIFVSVPYFVYPPRPLNIALLMIFAAYTGLVLYIIYALSGPFSPPGAIEPTPFIKLLEDEIGQWVSGVPDG